MAKQWTPEAVLQMAGAYQRAAVLASAVDLELFDALGGGSMTAAELAGRLRADARGMRVLLDALVALELLAKQDHNYSVPADVAEVLTARGASTRLAMAQHQANCMRRWVQLARVVKTGQPAERVPSVRGAEADQAAFIEAMDNISRPLAGPLVESLGKLQFHHLLDIGGASGTWTIAFLRAVPGATATIFDLPEVIPFARRRIAEAGLADRVRFAPGDFCTDQLLGGADYAWLSAIIHQNSPEQNRDLYRKVHKALTPGGRIAIRDIVMDETRTKPAGGALFAVNMLTGTAGGGTYTLDEIREDLERSGFTDVRQVRQGEWMDSIVEARKGA